MDRFKVVILAWPGFDRNIRVKLTFDIRHCDIFDRTYPVFEHRDDLDFKLGIFTLINFLIR